MNAFFDDNGSSDFPSDDHSSPDPEATADFVPPPVSSKPASDATSHFPPPESSPPSSPSDPTDATVDFTPRLTDTPLPDDPGTALFNRDSDHGENRTNIRIRRSAVHSGTFGNYEILEELGRGGMGIVYRARQLQPERIVALKVVRRDRLEMMPRDTQTSALDRFRQESQAAAQLMHDHIATVYEVGQVAGEPFYSMQYVQGESLADLLVEGPLSPRRAAKYLEAIARGVQAAHEHGVLHRDIKPGNVLIDSESDRPLVVDFGLAKLVETPEDLTCAGEVMGSPPYMSPEQATDASIVTGRSDVYSLGATLYHAITGRPPFQASSPLETIRQVIDGQPVAPRVLNATIDRDLETICLKCLEKEPARRYASAGAVADDLKSYLEGRPIVARPIGPVGRTWRWCRRNPVVASLIGATASAVVIALIASIVGYATTSAALRKAVIAQRQSEQSHRHSRGVVHRFFTRVSEDKLLNQPGMQPLQKELLSQAKDYYLRFLNERANDPTIRDELALTMFRVGRITEKIQSRQDAIESYEQAAKMQMELVAQSPNDLERVEALASTQNALGENLILLGRLEEAKKAYDQALGAREKLARMLPDEIEPTRQFANTFMNRGVLEKQRGLKAFEARDEDLAKACFIEAEDSYKDAMELREKLLARHPDHTATLRDAGKGHYNRAELAIIQQDDDSAIAHFGKAADVFERLVALQPQEFEYRLLLITTCRLLADMHCYLGDTTGEQQQWSQAECRYEQARGHAETLARGNPDVAEYQRALASIYMNLGMLAADRGEMNEAREHWRRAKDVLEPLVQEYPEVETYRGDLERIQDALNQQSARE